MFGGLSWTDTEFDFGGFSVGEDESLDGSIGLIYNQNAWLNPFASYATSLQPQRGELAGGGIVPFSEAEQIEVGLKSEWFGGRLRTTASLFQIEKTNIAQDAPDTPDPTDLVLAGDQRTRGAELEAVGQITDRISLIAGYSFLDAEFNESTTGNEGNTPRMVPEHKVSLFGQYAFGGALEGWRGGVGFIHVGDRWATNANTLELPTYERVDLNLAYERGPFHFRANIENVFDEDYIIGSSSERTSILEQGTPRLFTLTAGYEF